MVGSEDDAWVAITNRGIQPWTNLPLGTYYVIEKTGTDNADLKVTGYTYSTTTYQVGSNEETETSPVEVNVSAGSANTPVAVNVKNAYTTPKTNTAVTKIWEDDGGTRTDTT